MPTVAARTDTGGEAGRVRGTAGAGAAGGVDAGAGPGCESRGGGTLTGTAPEAEGITPCAAAGCGGAGDSAKSAPVSTTVLASDTAPSAK